MNLELGAAQVAEICAHGEETFPYECCGFLLGTLPAAGARCCVATQRMANETAETPERRFLV